MDIFCHASEHRINAKKTSIFFSRNVDVSTRDNILEACQFVAALGLADTWVLYIVMAR